MKEHEGNRKYRLELFSAMAAYMVVLFGSISFAKGMDEGLARTLLLVTPIVPLLLAVWAIARHFRRMDEYHAPAQSREHRDRSCGHCRPEL